MKDQMKPVLAEYQRLRKQAEKAMKFRGHTIGPWEFLCYGRVMIIAEATCIKCGKACVIDTKPAPNGIDIGGEAVALNCVKKEA